jgi:hypothetical protein
MSRDCEFQPTNDPEGDRLAGELARAYEYRNIPQIDTALLEMVRRLVQHGFEGTVIGAGYTILVSKTPGRRDDE